MLSWRKRSSVLPVENVLETSLGQLPAVAWLDSASTLPARGVGGGGGGGDGPEGVADGAVASGAVGDGTTRPTDGAVVGGSDVTGFEDNEAGAVDGVDWLGAGVDGGGGRGALVTWTS